MGASRRPLKTEFFHHLYFTAISNKKQWNEHGFYQSAYRKGGLFARLRVLNNPFGEVWRTRRSSKVNSYRPAFPGRSIFAEGADRTHRSFRSLANIGVPRAGRAQPLYLLTPLGRFGPSAQVSRLLNHSRFPNGRAHGFAAPLRVALRFAQVPTGHTLPFAPQGTRFLPAHLRVALPPLAATAHRAGASLRCRAGGEFALLGANIS